MAELINDVFTSDPTTFGWQDVAPGTFFWDTVNSVYGGFGLFPTGRYVKYLGTNFTQDMYRSAKFTLMVDAVSTNPNTNGLIGFFDSGGAWNVRGCFGLYLDMPSLIIPRLVVGYGDGTQVYSAGTYTLQPDTTYIIEIIYYYVELKGYLNIYDTSETLLHQETIDLTTSKTFSLNQVGFYDVSDNAIIPGSETESYFYDMLVLDEPVFSCSGYCSPEDVYLIVNAVEIKDLTDELCCEFIQMAMREINASLVGYYDVPFDSYPDAPPLIRTICQKLASCYVIRRLFIARAGKNESPYAKELCREAFMMLKDLQSGKKNLVDNNGEFIPRQDVSDTPTNLSRQYPEDPTQVMPDMYEIYPDTDGRL